MAAAWIAPDNVISMLNELKTSNHSRLITESGECGVTVVLADVKPFINNRFNWGTVKKFSEFNRLFMPTPIDFCIVVSSDAWHQILDNDQRKALIDLHLTRIEPEYLPEVNVVNGKKKPVKDEFGRVVYSQELKLDENGQVKWKVNPLDLCTFIDNVVRFGCWAEELQNFKEAME